MTATYTFDVFSSLDGYGAAGGDWTGYWGKQGPELLERRLEQYSEAQRMVFGATTYRQEIGIGKANTIERAEIFWPVTGQTEVLQDLAVNQAYHVREGDGRADLIHLKSFAWPGVSPAPRIVARVPGSPASLSPNS